MNNLEIFNKVEQHLLSQNAKSQIHRRGLDLFVCGYRGTEGRMCAVGCLIKDQYYSPTFEGESALDAGVIRALNQSGINTQEPSTMSMLIDLQMLHDRAPVSEWRDKLAEIRTKLEYNESLS